MASTGPSSEERHAASLTIQKFSSRGIGYSVADWSSITASETHHVGDAAAQTQETLDNIEALIGEENLARHGLPGRGTTLAGIGLARVYIKRKDDYERVRAVCERRLGELPTVYAVADICRPDLLVEIEGLALSRNALVPRR
jgi:enamine deaminase RidA (YjgF/YER057c/UK114 family)